MAEQTPKRFIVDGRAYPAEALTENMKGLIGNLRFVDTEVQRLRNQMVMTQAARTLFAQQLQQALAGVEPLDPPPPTH